ncbi:MAG: NAD(P)/FAD-dependent oxidoreductase [Elstera sp.]
MPLTDSPERIAIIGSGISGLGAAWSLRNRNITIFEKEPRPGGHSNTVDIALDGQQVPVDTGFIVYNERNYPNLTLFFQHLGVATAESDMSFSVSVDGGRLEYSGNSIATLFAQKRNLVNLRHWRMIRDILRFFRNASALLNDPQGDDLSLGEFLARGGYGQAFIQDHLLPMAAAIWSAPMSTLRAFPARSFAQFFANHGLLSVNDRPQWRTVAGGSRSYVQRVLVDLPNLQLNSGIETIRRTETGVEIRHQGAWQSFDRVLLACHADQALRLLDDADASEWGLLDAFRFQPNTAYLHRDVALMPRRRRAWASWNHLSRTAPQGRDEDADVSVTYWMNRLQPLATKTDVFVTLNPLTEPDPALTYARIDYDHPIFDHAAVSAQARLSAVQGYRNIFYAGAWTGYGFHEDGLRSGLRAGLALGGSIPWALAEATKTGARLLPDAAE